MTDEEINGFVAINFTKHFKTIRGEQDLKKFAKSLYIFLKTPDEVEKYMESNYFDNCVHHIFGILDNFDPELQLINTKPVIKKKLKELLSELKMFKVQIISVLG